MGHPVDSSISTRKKLHISSWSHWLLCVNWLKIRVTTLIINYNILLITTFFHRKDVWIDACPYLLSWLSLKISKEGTIDLKSFTWKTAPCNGYARVKKLTVVTVFHNIASWLWRSRFKVYFFMVTYYYAPTTLNYILNYWYINKKFRD